MPASLASAFRSFHNVGFAWAQVLLPFLGADAYVRVHGAWLLDCIQAYKAACVCRMHNAKAKAL